MRPLVLRGVVADDPAMRLWSFEYLRTTFGEMKVRMERKDEGESNFNRSDVPRWDLECQFLCHHLSSFTVKVH
jgi:hypothetical protein